MVICVFAFEGDQQQLHELGARDSKQTTHAKRKLLYEKLLEHGESVCEFVPADEITSLMKKRVSLNEIEALNIGEALNILQKKLGCDIDEVFVDSPDPNPEKFAQRIKKYFNNPKTKITSSNKAESKYPTVAAASIVAKVCRDAELERIKKEVGKDFGSGYTHDQTTINYLKKNHNEEKVQKYIRHQWKTIKNLKTAQLDLEKYI